MSSAPRGWPWILIAAALLAAGLGRMSLVDPDEGRYAAAAREMIRTGDPIVPRFNGEPRLNKPPLLYWLMAGAFILLGPGESAARLPSLVAAAATLGLILWWARIRMAPAMGRSAVSVLATCAIFFACARLATTDMLLTLWITATLLTWHEAAVTTDRGSKRRLALASGLACGLAAMTKGPVGIVLPGLVIAVTAAVTGKRGMITLRGLAIALCGQALVVGPWLYALIGRVGLAEVAGILSRETGDRIAGGLDHPRPFYYLLANFWVTFLPWSLAAPLALWRSLPRRGSGETAGPFLAAWLGTVLIFFSLVADKNDAYLLPAAPALALLVALTAPWGRLAWISAAMAVALLTLVLLASERISLERSLERAVTAARLDRRGDYTLLAYRLYRPSLVFYSGRPARWVTAGSELTRVLEEAPRDRPMAVVMTERRYQGKYGEMLGKEGFEAAGGQPGYVVLFRDSGSGGDSP